MLAMQDPKQRAGGPSRQGCWAPGTWGCSLKDAHEQPSHRRQPCASRYCALAMCPYTGDASVALEYIPLFMPICLQCPASQCACYTACSGLLDNLDMPTQAPNPGMWGMTSPATCVQGPSAPDGQDDVPWRFMLLPLAS